MSHLVFQDNLSFEVDYLHKVVGRQASKEAFEWLEDILFQFVHKNDNHNFYNAFKQASGMLGHEKVELTERTTWEADLIFKGFKPQKWNLSEAGRALLLITLPHQSVNEYLQIINNLFSTFNLEDSIALYKAFPLLPYSEKHMGKAIEGIKSNVTAIFESIALNNSYPATYFEEALWNQMVLKAVNIGLPIYEICGFDEKRNSDLAKMLIDYAHDSWTHGNQVSPELWRAVGPFLTEKGLEDIRKLINSDNQLNQIAAALVCIESDFGPAKDLLKKEPLLHQVLEEKAIDWESLGQNLI